MFPLTKTTISNLLFLLKFQPINFRTVVVGNVGVGEVVEPATFVAVLAQHGGLLHVSDKHHLHVLGSVLAQYAHVLVFVRRGMLQLQLAVEARDAFQRRRLAAVSAMHVENNISKI